MKIYLLRHGESTSNPREHMVINGVDREAPLSARGERQTERLAGGLSSTFISPIHTIYTSPARRARQTLALLRSAPAVAKASEIIDERLIELNQGVAEGEPRDEVYTPSIIQQRDTLGRDFAFPNGESMNDAAARLSEWLASLTRHHQPDTVILGVSHAMLIRSYVSSIENWTFQETLDRQLENCHAVELDLSVDGTVRLIQFNVDLAQ